MNIKIGHLYPNELNLYGDRGNIECLQKRCLWRDIECDILPIKVGMPAPLLSEIDILFMGGGEDNSQKQIYSDFINDKKSFLEQYINGGKVGLFICGGFQLLGKYYRPYSGKDIPGLGVLDIFTKHFGRDKKRLVGNVICKITGLENLEAENLVGFENHGGRTYFEKDILPFAEIKVGSGNNDEDKNEGVIFKNCIGTYLHGPILPKNPHVADYLIQTALEIKYKKEMDLAPLDDELEWHAHKNALKLSS